MHRRDDGSAAEVRCECGTRSCRGFLGRSRSLKELESDPETTRQAVRHAGDLKRVSLLSDDTLQGNLNEDRLGSVVYSLNRLPDL